MLITGTAHTDPLMVELNITGLPATTARIEVLDGLTQHRVTRQPTSGTTALVLDYTAPAGEATYLIRAFNAGDVQVDEGNTTVTTSQPPSSHVWLSDPLDETSPVLVPMMIDGDRTRPRHADIAVAHTLGGRSIASVGPQHRGVWQIVIKAVDPEMIRRLQVFIDNASSVLVRAGTEMFLPGRMYGVLPDSSESLRLYGDPPTGYWTLNIGPATAPGIDSVISTWTWDALEAFCEAHDITWDTLGDTFPTWIDVERGPIGGGD